MDVKEYLKQAYRLNELVQSNELEITNLNELKDSLPGIDFSNGRVQSGYQGDASFARVVEKIIDLEKVIKEDTERLLSLKQEIREAINNVFDNEQKLVLKLRYLNFLSWEKVAEKMNVSQRTAIRIHDIAIKNVVIPKS